MAATAKSKNDKEVLGFQAETKQILKLMINSLYSNKEIFVRELISNASDACDKLRFESLANPALLENDPEFKIHVSFDAEQQTITFSDNGIGMTRDEVIQNIGTIARSGTKDFFEKLTGDKQKDANLIGQFGVGFYSAFIVADKVTLATRKAGEPADSGVVWESQGEGEYSLESVAKETRGTSITLHLKKDENEFLEEYRLQTVIKKFSDHISIPVVMAVTKTEGEGDDAKEIKTDETINQASALWTRAKTQIKQDEYNEFYKAVSHDFSNPLSQLHVKLEGNLEYTLLLFIPERAPFDLWTQEHRLGVKLYVKKVFIMDDAEKLLPKYLRFVRGVVDSNDLPLNVSREILQENRVIATIRSTAVKKILDLLEDMAKNDKEKFAIFWKEFGRVFKEGIVEDFANKERIASICRFASTFDDKEDQAVSLDDYIFRLKKDQDKIFYLTADNFLAAKNHPLLEGFRKNGIEVLLLTDRVDHWVVSHLNEYKGKTFQSIAKGDLDLDKFVSEDDQKSKESQTEVSSDLVNRIKEALKEDVSEIKMSKRLTTSPACLVASAHDLDPAMKRLFEQMGQSMPESKPVLEINGDHRFIKKLEAETDEKRFASWAKLLFEQSVLADGGQLDDPSGFVKRLNELLLS